MQKNRELAQVFRFLANALEWQGENAFKVRAYRSAAETLEALQEPVQALVERDALRDLPHIGEAIDKKVRQYLAEGTFPALQRVREQVPEGIQQLLRLPGMTGRAARALQERLGIEDIDGLRHAAQDGSLWREKWTPAVKEAIAEAIRSSGLSLDTR
jgi:DNA polymerase (family 10)